MTVPLWLFVLAGMVIILGFPLGYLLGRIEGQRAGRLLGHSEAAARRLIEELDR